MLSSLSSFLPTALHDRLQSNHAAPAIDVDDDEGGKERVEGDGEDHVEEDGESNRKKKKEKFPHETFIFVRPPPAKSNHPLNLQVQLVPPNPRNRRQSLESRASASDAEGNIGTDNEGGHSRSSSRSLRRTPSVASDYSATSTTASGYGSTSSFASYSSSASATSGRRVIIPLYNLHAHNVMTNTIVDAGTDAKIAKFQKRGLEMMDLAVLEPVEVWVSPPGAAAVIAAAQAQGGPTMTRGFGTSSTGAGTNSARGSLDIPAEHSLKTRLSFLGRPGAAVPPSPGSSALSLSSAGHLEQQPFHQDIPQRPTVQPTQTAPPIAQLPAKKNIFGRMFDRKKKPESSVSSPQVPQMPEVQISSPTTPTPSSALPKTPKTPSPHSPTPKTPTQQAPSSPRHSRGLSSSIFRKSSPANDPEATPNPNNSQPPASPVNRLSGLLRPGSSAGAKRPTSVQGQTAAETQPRSSLTIEQPGGRTSTEGGRLSREPSREHEGDFLPPTATSSRFSTLSQQSTNSGLPPSTPMSPNASVQQNPIPTLPATLGIVPTLSTPGGPVVLTSGLFNSFSSKGYPPPKELGFGKGPAMYVWVVRRWFKGPGAQTSFMGKGLQGLGIKGIGGSGNGSGEVEELVDINQIEVRVEWKRGGKKKREKVREKRRQRKEAAGTDVSTSRRSSFLASSNTSVHTADDEDEKGKEKARKKKNRLSSLSIGSLGASSNGGHSLKGKRNSLIHKRRTTVTGSDGEETQDDSDSDSDPEDSETPWGCTIKVRRLAAVSGKSKAPLKLKAGTLTPTPHHPKVVAMLKVPFPLPDLEVDRLKLRKREGKIVPPSAGETGLVLTAEELKDVICGTGLWIVVREGFGGVGKVSRKGDGWRIRA